MLPHPPHSPDLVPSDYHPFPKLTEHLKGQRFSCDEEVKSAVRKLFKNKTLFLKGGFKNWCNFGGNLLKCWRFCGKIIMQL